MCSKMPFRTRAEANAHGRWTKKHGRGKIGNLRPYECKACGQWHLTASYTARDDRRIEKRRKAS